jgi:fumarate reductase subunit D
MTRSNEPFAWMPFAAGGMVAALITPAVIFCTGLLAPLGLVDLSFDRIVALLHSAPARLIVWVVVALPAWHAAHRIQATIHDLGWGGGMGLKRVCYGSAVFIAVLAALALLRL